MSERIAFGGLLSGLTDPEVMAHLAERERIAELVAERMGVSLREAYSAVDGFAEDLAHDGALN